MKNATNTLKEISLEELTAWIKKNPHITWNFESGGFNPENRNKPGRMRGKYIRFNLDTRDMKIFRLELDGSGDDIVVDFRDEGEGTLLDELDRILAEDK